MKKLYIIDTCTIVHHPQVLTTLKDCAIVLPITVLEELDKLKSKNDQAGKNARIACKLLSDLTEDKNPSQWFSLDSGSKFLIDSSEYHKDMNLGDPLYGDNRILACALHYHKACASTSYEAVFLTRDVNAKVRSRAYGVKSEHYEKDGLKSELPFSGIKHLDDSELINNLFQDGFIDPSLAPEMLPNEFLVLRDKEEETVGIARMKFQDLSIVEKQYPWDLSPKNPEQVCAINLLMDPDVSLVTLIGSSGSGKSILTLAASLEMVINRQMYDKVVIYRPIQAVGADVGFLPGGLEEKLEPWMEAVYDSIEVLFKDSKEGKGGKNSKFKRQQKDWREDFQMYIEKGQVELNCMTHVRGRSLPNCIIFIDEVQNISKSEIKTLLTRAGENTKIILTGDIEQIDNPSLDATNNGLSYVLEKFKDYHIAGHVTLTRGERSELATIASEIL